MTAVDIGFPDRLAFGIRLDDPVVLKDVENVEFELGMPSIP